MNQKNLHSPDYVNLSLTGLGCKPRIRGFIILDMEKKHELTEKLKVLENNIHEAKVDLKAINIKLNIAYEYETELLKRQAAAHEKTEELKLQFFQKSSAISDLHNEMKNIFDIFTGNFYKS